MKTRDEIIEQILILKENKMVAENNKAYDLMFKYQNAIDNLEWVLDIDGLIKENERLKSELEKLTLN